MNSNQNIPTNGWSEYGKLVLNELERLNEGQAETSKSIQELTNKVTIVEQEVDAHRNVDEKVFGELAQDISDINSKLDGYMLRVNEVWSPNQMQQAKDELYRQKNQWQKVAGIIIAINVIGGILFALFSDKL